MNKFNRAPLPFQGQKRNFIRLFNELIKAFIIIYHHITLPISKS
ncbi:MAG: hypothetical protein ACTTJC_07055 [Campylobacter sp.]